MKVDKLRQLRIAEGNSRRSYGLPSPRYIPLPCDRFGAAIVEFNAAMDNYENFTTISIGREQQRRNVDKS